MLSLEVQISKRTNRWVDVTNDFLNITSRNYLSGCKYWRTMKGCCLLLNCFVFLSNPML